MLKLSFAVLLMLAALELAYAKFHERAAEITPGPALDLPLPAHYPSPGVPARVAPCYLIWSHACFRQNLHSWHVQHTENA